MIPNLWHLNNRSGAARAARARARRGWPRTPSRCVGAGGAGRGRRPDPRARPGRIVVVRKSRSAFRSICPPGGPRRTFQAVAGASATNVALGSSCPDYRTAAPRLEEQYQVQRATRKLLAHSHFPRAAEYSRLHHHAPRPRDSASRSEPKIHARICEIRTVLKHRHAPSPRCARRSRAGMC